MYIKRQLVKVAYAKFKPVDNIAVDTSASNAVLILTVFSFNTSVLLVDAERVLLADAKRAANFTSKEESLLVGLVKKYKSVLECKLTDMKTHSEKATCWARIEADFNSTSGEAYRPKNVLRKKYENIKKRVKKKFVDDKCYARGTGGEPSKNTQFTSLDEEIKEILGKRIEGHQSEFGGDAYKPEENSDIHVINSPDTLLKEGAESIHTDDKYGEEETITLEVYQQDTNEIIPVRESSPSVSVFPATTSHGDAPTGSTTWADYNPLMLRQHKTPALCTKAKKTRDTNVPIRDRVSQWAGIKSNIEMSKQKYIEKEQEMKLQFLREKHELELKLMQDKAQLQIENETKEHRLRVEILELEKQKLLNTM